METTRSFTVNLKTIEDYNQEKLHQYERETKTGVACPNCENELEFLSDVILPSNPPQRTVKCHDCDYYGLVYA